MRRLALITILAACAGAAARPSSPAARAGCSDAGDRTTKLTLIERLARSPQILILGSSRARTVEPSFLEELTGRSGFNAAVTGGTAADAWVMTRYAAARFPAPRRYLWFVDTGIATDGVPPDLAADPRARAYLGGARRAAAGACRVSSRYRADGSLAYGPGVSRVERERIVDRSVAKLVASIRAHPPLGGPVDPRRYVWFERAIAYMNRHGSRPVIVLNPIHPRVLAELERIGFPARKTALAYLDELRRRLDLVVVDCEDIRAWGGSASDFTNATHIDRSNMRRLLRYVVARSGGALGS